MRPSYSERAHIPGLIGNAGMLHMCLITHKGSEMMLAQTWHTAQWINSLYVYYNQAGKSKRLVQEAERMRELIQMGESTV